MTSRPVASFAAAKRPATDADRAKTSTRVSNTGRALSGGATGRGWSSGGDSAAAPTLHSFGGTPSYRRDAAQLSIGRPDDRYEAEAERAADAVVAKNPATTSSLSGAGRTRHSILSKTTASVQARAAPGVTPEAPAGLPQRMQDARPEGRPLSSQQRAFYEDRLGHDFSAVRIHAGPAAAAAASSVQAQAFAHGQDIYFGQNYYRPDSQAGRRLMAHELAHTVQQRPNVIARRALDAAVDGGAPTTPDGPTSPNQSVTPASADVAPALAHAPDDGVPAMPPPMAQADMVLPPQRADALVTAAAGRMQALVRSAEADAAQATTDTSEAPEEGGGPARAGSTGGAAASQTTLAAQAAMATFDARLAELSGRRSAEIRFQEDESGSVEGLELRLRRNQSTSLASTFLRGVGEHVEAIIGAARELPAQLQAGLTGATGAIDAAAKAQTGVLRASAEASRQKVKTQTAQTRGLIQRKRKESDQATAQTVQTSRDKALAARGDAIKDIDKAGNEQATSIETSYRRAVWPMKLVGYTAGAKAYTKAESKSNALLAQRDGESSLLDGPIHDNRLEASAEAALQVGGEYVRSFQKSADEQAAKLPESKPEVLGKVKEVTTQAQKGLDDQLKQVSDGADGFAKSATARTRKVAGDFSTAAGKSGTQTTAAISAAEEQQATELASFGAAQANSLDQSVASGLGSLTDGVSQTVGGLMQSMDDFVASAASMAPPEPEQLSSSLGEVMDQTAATADSMGTKIQAIGPAMVESVATGRDQSLQMLTEAAANAIKSIDGTREQFSKGAIAFNQQTVSGFDRLGKGDQKSAQAIGTQAATGFSDAALAAGKNFTAFGKKVEENFALGRDQVLASLWSDKTKSQLDEDMEKYGKEAAAQVQPRWKKVLKWVITIVVIVAVVVVTVATAGALGPVGVILLGAALGAAAGAVTTIANNLIDGKKWSDGVAKAMIVGAIGGAVGGAGGVIVKGVGSVVLKVGLEAGINVVGGVVSEVVASLAVGETINWTNAIMGALIGAGIGAGLGIAGALKGKIRFGSMAEVPAPPKVKPQVEVPQPSGRVRSMLEQAKILAPRPGAVPEAGIGAAPGGAPKAEPRVGPPEPAPGVAKGPAAPELAAPLPEPSMPRPQPAAADTAVPAGPAKRAPAAAPPEPAAAPRQPEPSVSAEDAVAPRESGIFPRPQRGVAPTSEGVASVEPRPEVGSPAAPDNVRPISSARRARAAAQPESAAGPAQPEPRVNVDASQPPSSRIPSQPEPSIAPSNERVATAKPGPEPGSPAAPDNVQPIGSARRARAGAQSESATAPSQAEPRANVETAPQPQSSGIPAQAEPSIAPASEGAAPAGPPSQSSAPDNLRQLGSAKPGRAGPRPNIKGQKPLAPADELAARRAARAATPPEAQPQVQQEPLAMVSGVKSQAQVIEVGTGGGGGGAPENVAGGRNPVEAQAVQKPPGGPPRPLRSVPEGGGSQGSQVSEPAGRPPPAKGPRPTSLEAETPPPQAASEVKPVLSEEVAAVKPGKGATSKGGADIAEGESPPVKRSIALDKNHPGGPKAPDITVPEGAPTSGAGSLDHKINAWNDYQARGGKLPYDKWSNVYSANMERAKIANEAADRYFNEEGHASWGERERVVDIAESAVDRIKARFRRMEARTRLEGNPRKADFSELPDPTKRRLDIGPKTGSGIQRGIEHKTGYVTRSDEVLWEAARDIELAQGGWQMEWVVKGKIVEDLKAELERAGIKVILR